MKQTKKSYKIIGAYDSETTNVKIDNIPAAFPILHQLGVIDCDISEITSGNVELKTSIFLYRHISELYEKLIDIINSNYNFIPVLLCHNLAFDMYPLAEFLNSYNIEVLAKSKRKPISFKIKVNNDTRLVIWDTLIFSQQSLERMGKDCGYAKAVGSWDYDLVRTPETPLTQNEIDYAKKDIYTLLVWVSWFLKNNPEITSDKLGFNVVTKTGIVRQRRKIRFEKLKGINSNKTVGYYWLSRCNLEKPKSDDELFTMQAATRGGFTFCSQNNASKVFELEDSDKCIIGFDATSQHPAQIVSHLYPVNFKKVSKKVLELSFDLVSSISFDRILKRFDKPFPVAFYASFKFKNLRPKRGSFFEKWGIYPIASSKYISFDEDNGDKINNDCNLESNNYIDTFKGLEYAFGKVIKADEAILFLTELSAWEVCQSYEWDSIEPISGYQTGNFTRPNDIDILSVFNFYKAKNAFKDARSEFYKNGFITNPEKLINLDISEYVAQTMANGTALNTDIESTYLSLKADLNAIFGISCSNEYRRNTVLADDGIDYSGEFGICNEPKNSKVWYQFGQRIVGWSRIAQILIMYLSNKYAITCINGDTDSIKLLINEQNIPKLEKEFKRLNNAIDESKKKVCVRVKINYPNYFDELEGIGHYIEEFRVKNYCAAWNKSYVIFEDGHFNFTIAGIPTKTRHYENLTFLGIDKIADRYFKLGYSFEEICNIFLGYNKTYSNDVIKLNSRKFPDWGDRFKHLITDYLGFTNTVDEPCALALYPQSKTINDLSKKDNKYNLVYALKNNKNLNYKNILITANGLVDMDDLNEFL